MKPILVIEDNDDDFFALTRLFARAGLKNPVHRCCNGKEALDCILASKAEVPGLILLDLNMPGENGKEVLAALKALPAFCDIPVIVLTTSCAREDVRRCYDAGADSYLFKPMDMEGFINSIARIKDERKKAGFELDLPGLT